MNKRFAPESHIPHKKKVYLFQVKLLRYKTKQDKNVT